ncbi:NTP transferase domain-containing protein [Candidatus Peregrinibacteria bacterium]|nr:MAG: NTP transferase domain-containing protein [Candidatus Peregrinibacteria bacterium]
MHVILLAAGVSNRLKPIGDKGLLEFLGKPLIQHQVEQLRAAGFLEIVLVANPTNLAALQAVFDGDDRVTFVTQTDDRGMAGGVLAAADLVDQDVLIVSNNDVFEPELFTTLKNHPGAMHGTLVGKKVTEYFPGGYLSLNDVGHLTSIVEKPGAGNEPSDLVNLVVHRYHHFSELVALLKTTTSEADDLYEKALDRYLRESKAEIDVLPYSGYWQPIKYPWHILEVSQYFLETMQAQVDPSAHIHPSAIVEGNVRIDAGVNVMANAVIQGPAYLGKNSVVGNNSLVRGSMIGRDSVVGFTTEVARSYLNHHVWMHTNYIGDSVVDENVSFGAGTVLGNLRFDEENIKVRVKDEKLCSKTNKLGAFIGSGARFGINGSTNPGVKIGRNSFIGGNVLVDRDIDDDQMVLLEQSLNVMKNNKSANVTKGRRA